MYGMWLYITMRFIVLYLFKNKCSDAFLTCILYLYADIPQGFYNQRNLKDFFNVCKHLKHEMSHAGMKPYQYSFCDDFFQENQILIDTLDDFISLRPFFSQTFIYN